jgi:hypothetical protein
MQLAVFWVVLCGLVDFINLSEVPAAPAISLIALMMEKASISETSVYFSDYAAQEARRQPSSHTLAALLTSVRQFCEVSKLMDKW